MQVINMSGFVIVLPLRKTPGKGPDKTGCKESCFRHGHLIQVLADSV